ncbi:MAG TPA: DUF885 domain-containing protein [Pseudonocardiaceae bacterium]|jgi:uncharacterized protein (DUF885 family)|nr:DUF885 domain-containing protein [Pseudonocardiaceae bacterium]
MVEPATTVTALADELVDVVLKQEPLYATLLGVDGAHDRLADLSAEAEQVYRVRYTDIVARAEAIDPAALPVADRVTRSVVIQQAQAKIAQLDTKLVEFTITDFFVAPAPTLLTVLPMIALPDAERAQAYLSRLAAVPDYLDGAAHRHRQGLSAGRLPVVHLVDAAIKHIDRYLADPQHDPLRTPVPPEGALADFTTRRDEVLADTVRPAFARYRDMLAAEVLPVARPSDRPGLHYLAEGAATYQAMIAVNTTTDRTPEDLHATGLAIIDSLAREYAEIGRRVFGTDDLQEIFRRLRTDPALRWDSGEELLAAARAAIERAEAAAPGWFGRLPGQRCQVRAVPDNEAPGAAAAYYMQPALDGSRPGVYFANTHRVTERFRQEAESTAFHEAVPGHHFQLTIALELTDLPLLRRIADVNAYIEGWGLYSERLADEMGLYSDDIARLGMLTADSMRAGRLVVDTGIHAKGWTRAQTIDYLRQNTPMSEVEIEAETDRYIASPGQALSYMVGRLELQRLRGVAERALGERFDIRAFHDLVLGNGPLPLSVLEEVVSEWVKSVG